MNRKSVIFILNLSFGLLIYSSLSLAKDWTYNLKQPTCFVENQGQFNLVANITGERILYAYETSHEAWYFSENKVFIHLFERSQNAENESDKSFKRKKSKFNSTEEWKDYEKKHERLNEKSEWLEFEFKDHSDKLKVEAVQKNDFYHSYTFRLNNGKTINKNNIPSYQKLIYTDVYNGIDLEFEFHPSGGIKYSFIVNPGASVSSIKMESSHRFSLNEHGCRTTDTKFGKVLDSAPVAYYEGNLNEKIGASFEINNRITGFKLNKYDNSKKIIIDPWIQTPAFNSNWDCVWECEADSNSNVYIIGGVTPLQLLKYNSAGVLQWVYNTPYDTTAWLGTFATDMAGNSYVTNGTAAAIQKINTNGSLVWNNPNPGGLFSSTELWNISFNCDQTRLVVGGTGGLIVPLPYIYEIDMNSGNVLNSIQVTASNLFDAQEVRSITSCGNAKYYYLTHDSIGYVHQSLNSCLNGSFPFHTSNGYDLGYKCENWRYNNTGIMAIRHYNGFIYINRGNQIHKRDFYSGAILTTATIPGGSYTNVFLGGNVVGNSGIDIDSCGNIFVGSTNGVYRFDTNLNPTGSFSTSFAVYDVKVSYNGDVVACGSTGNSQSNNRTGSVQVFSAFACKPQRNNCCDATVCQVPSLCTGDAPVQLIATTSGGAWSGNGVNASGVFDPATAGQGNHTITYALPCGSESVTIVVNNCSALDVCLESNGQLTVSGGTGPYNWQQQTTTQDCSSCLIACIFPPGCAVNVTNWTTFTNGVTITPSVAYPIQVVDNAGTVYLISSDTLLQPCSVCPPISGNIDSLTNIQCAGGMGSATVSSSSGNGPWVFNWMPGNLAGASQNNLLAGQYQVTISDSNGCSGLMTVTLTEPPLLQSSNNGSIGTSCGQTNGSAFADITGGTGPYSINWYYNSGLIQSHSNVLSIDSVNNLIPGWYQYVITDFNSCSFSDSVQVDGSTAPNGSILSQTDAQCGSANGTMTVSVSGGAGPYSIDWIYNGLAWQTSTGVVQVDSMSGMAAGLYELILLDSLGCSDTLITSISNLNAPSLNLLYSDGIQCFGQDSAYAVIQASGGSSPYTFNWSLNGINIQNTTSVTIDTLIVGNGGLVNLVLTDASGCISTAQVNLNSPSGPLQISAINTGAASCGQSDGFIQIGINGGTLPVNYIWSPPVSTSASALNISSGVYQIQLIDSNGCQIDTIITISDSGAPLVSVSNIIQPQCNSSASGNVTVTGIGGIGPLQYLWSNGQTGNILNNVTAGNYQVTVTDSLGCSGVANVSLTDPPLITAQITVQNANCNQANGTATVQATGGTGPLSYEWSNGSQTNVANGLSAGNVNVVVSDSLGCIQIFTSQISNSGLFSIDAGYGTTILAGETVNLDASSSVNGVYLWTPSESLSCSDCLNPIASPGESTLYTLTVTYNGCTVSDTVRVLVEVKCGDVYVPSAFSPDENNMNDHLRVRGNCIKELDFRVYDRWGNLLFESHDQNTGWNGTFEGKALNAGVYTYYVSAVVKDEIVTLKGNVTLIRGE